MIFEWTGAARQTAPDPRQQAVEPVALIEDISQIRPSALPTAKPGGRVSGKDRDARKGAPDDRKPDSPRDLIEFHLRWREFRPLAKQALESSALSSGERETLHWLIMLADRVSAEDIID